MKHRFLAQALLPCLAASIALLPAPKASYAQLAPAAKGVQLAAHRAVYELTLDHTGAGSNVSDIRGQLTYDFSGSECQGYTLNTRLVTEIFDRESKPSITDIRSEAQEDAEGKRFRIQHLSVCERQAERKHEGSRGAFPPVTRHCQCGTRKA